MKLLCYSKNGPVVNNKAPCEWLEYDQIELLLPMQEFFWRREYDVPQGNFTLWEVKTKDGSREYCYPIFSDNFNDGSMIDEECQYDNDWYFDYCYNCNVDNEEENPDEKPCLEQDADRTGDGYSVDVESDYQQMRDKLDDQWMREHMLDEELA